VTEAVEVEQIDRDAARERLAAVYELEAAQHDSRGYKRAAANQREKARVIRAGTAELQAVEAIIAARTEALEDAAKVADYGVDRAERDWRDPIAQQAVKQVCAEIAEVIRYETIRALSPIKDRNNAG
jgi:hypothetical protein